MAEIYVPGAIDIMGSANQMMQFRNSQQAQQANALQMQYAAEDRAREAENRKIAAGNALAERLRKQQFISTIQSGYMPAKTAVMGPGTVQGNTPASFDPEKIKNELLRRGDLSGLVTFSNAQEQLAKQQEQEAKVTGQGLTNEGTRAANIGIDYKNTADFIKMTNAQIDSVPDIASLKAVVAATFTPGHPMAKFNELNGLTLEQSMAAIDDLIAQGKTFEQIREQMSQGATKAAENIAARGLVAAQTGTATANTAKIEAETAAAKDAFTIENVQTSTGPIRVKVFKDGRVERLKLGDETLAPEVTPVAPTDLEKLQDLEVKLRAADPNDPRLADVRNAIVKLTTQAPGQTININQVQESELEKALGKGQGEVALKSQATAQDAADMINTIKIGRGLVQQGIVTGFGADFRVDLGRALKLAGIETGDDAVANTQAFAATMAQNVGKLIKQFGAGTGLSDADREYAIKMAGGQITLDEGAIKKILGINERAAKNTIEQHNKKYGGIKTTVPLTVDVPSDITSNATNSTSVITPDGKTHNFPSLEAAAQFKKAAGIK